MEPKLTVRVPAEILEGAKRYAQLNRTTLTRLVSEYFRRLADESDPLQNAPITRRLSGSIPADHSIEDYHRYLEGKYGSEDPRTPGR